MKWITLLFTLFILQVILWANTGTMPGALEMIYDFPNGDKVGHFILFGTLSFLVNKTTISMFKRSPKGIILSVSLILMLLVGFEEWTQQFLPNRTYSWIDLAFSYAGITLGAWLTWRFRNYPAK
jgi:VanZ family protein